LESFPSLSQFARFLDISVKDVAHAASLDELFQLPISQQAAAELEELNGLMQNFELTEGPDMRVYCWGSSIFFQLPSFTSWLSHIWTLLLFLVGYGNPELFQELSFSVG
jgi:hypothetical protein